MPRHPLRPFQVHTYLNLFNRTSFSSTSRTDPRIGVVAPITTLRRGRGGLEWDSEQVKSRVRLLKTRLEKVGVHCDVKGPGQYEHLLCPRCGGGDSKERSFSIFIRNDGERALWSCMRGRCGWRGHVEASGVNGGDQLLQSTKQNTRGTIKNTNHQVQTEEGLKFEPLCHQMENPNCYCGRNSILRTSWTPYNPGRRFWGCARYGSLEGSCAFFEWYDAPMCQRSKDVIHCLLKDDDDVCKTRRTDVQLLELQLRQLQKENERLQSRCHVLELMFGKGRHENKKDEDVDMKT